MEKKLEKSLKRYLKRKVKITTAFIVAFLLGSLSTYASVDVKYESGEIKFYRHGNLITDQEELKKFGTIIGDSINGFTWTINGELLRQLKLDGSLNAIKNFEIINNGIISGNVWIDYVNSGNGIIFNSSAKLKNDGIILGNHDTDDFSGNGLIVSSGLPEIDNNGIIKGNNGGVYNSNNGIIVNGQNVNLDNDGIITGEKSKKNSTGMEYFFVIGVLLQI